MEPSLVQADGVNGGNPVGLAGAVQLLTMAGEHYSETQGRKRIYIWMINPSQTLTVL